MFPWDNPLGTYFPPYPWNFAGFNVLSLLQLALVFDEVERDFHLLGATAVEDK